MKAKVSVIIPVYGVEKYLRQCLDSALAQTLREIEIIIVDDGSKDKCPAIIDEYAAKDARIVAIHKSNAGYGAACNTGFAAAKGEYIAIFEPDDFIALDMYEKLYQCAITTGADITRCEFYRVTEAGENPKASFCEGLPPKASFTLEEAPSLITYQPSVWAALYNREWMVRNEIKMPEPKGAGQVDINFKMSTYFASSLISYLREPLYYYRVNEGSSVKRRDDPGLEAHRWREADQLLIKHQARAESLKKYIYKSKLSIFKWALLDRIDSKHQDEFLRIWQEMFKSMDLELVAKDPLFSRLERNFFTSTRNGSFLKLKWHLFGEIRKRLISVRLNPKNSYIYVLRNKGYLFGFKMKLGMANFRFSIGDPNKT